MGTKKDVKKYLKKDHSMSKKEIGKFLDKFCKLKFGPKVPPAFPMCCMAMTSKCLACKEGVSEKKYCKKNPNTNGCSGKGGDGSPVVGPQPCPKSVKTCPAGFKRVLKKGWEGRG